jgi:hypothetical protein
MMPLNQKTILYILMSTISAWSDIYWQQKHKQCLIITLYTLYPEDISTSNLYGFYVLKWDKKQKKSQIPSLIHIVNIMMNLYTVLIRRSWWVKTKLLTNEVLSCEKETWNFSYFYKFIIIFTICINDGIWLFFCFLSHFNT